MGLQVDSKMMALEALELREVLNFIEDKWQDVKRDFGNTDTTKRIVLTTVRIAKELIDLKNKQEHVSKMHEKKFNNIIKQLEQLDIILN
ncbi:MAG: cell division protein ZapA [Elusimicrobiota bacterium]|nr:cell division protein ZapA [Elusimicrobiota bacterium]